LPDLERAVGVVERQLRVGRHRVARDEVQLDLFRPFAAPVERAMKLLGPAQ